jgi:hypothetical protein
MPFWIVWFGEDGKIVKDGSYSSETQAQRIADSKCSLGSYEIVESRSSDWSRARGEVVNKLTYKLKDMSLATKRYRKFSKDSQF